MISEESIQKRVVVAEDVLKQFVGATVTDLGIMVEEIQVWVAILSITCPDGKKYIFNLREPPDIREVAK
jgi:hypothetical protein